jgi:cytochrome c1
VLPLIHKAELPSGIRLAAAGLMKAALVGAGALLLVAVLGTAFVYSGWYNVAASEPHTPLVHEILTTTARRSIEARAENIVVPTFNREQVARGAVHYNENCAVCHGAPGAEPASWARA